MVTLFLLYSLIFTPLPVDLKLPVSSIERQTVIINGNSFQALGCPFVKEVSLGSRVVTGYSSTIDQCDSTPFITANGERVDEGTIACPRYIPFGTMVKIDEKIYTCNDRMSSKYAHRFDIWFASREEAKGFGKQVKEVIKLL